MLIPTVSFARQRETTAPLQAGGKEVGVASWHAPRRASRESVTASGRAWSGAEMVAAHRSIPFGARVRVVNLRNGRNVVVQITDRGPYTRGRIIDLSQSAAVALGFINAGCAPVRLERLPAAP